MAGAKDKVDSLLVQSEQEFYWTRRDKLCFRYLCIAKPILFQGLATEHLRPEMVNFYLRLKMTMQYKVAQIH